MKLKFLLEEAGSYEIKDLVTNFPSKHGKALQKMWGKSGALLYKGQPLFKDGSLGAAYEGAMEAAEKMQGRTVATSLYFDGSSNDVELEVDEMQEVYLGYDKKQDKLYIGYDVWLNDESVEREFDKSFEDITGDRFDADNDEHSKIFRDWRNSKDYPGFSGFLFELSSKDGKTFKADLIQDSSGGFYKGIYGGHEFKRLGLVDLRLD
jgi:hypothetical protein